MKHERVPISKAQQVYEVSIHYKRPLFSEMKYITQSQDMYNVMIEYLDGESLDYKERMWLICLTRSNRILSLSLLSIGTHQATLVSIPEIIQISSLKNASAVILVHNHPSGNLVFSEKDKELTKKIQEVLKLMSLQLLDHLVITSESHISMADENIVIN